jgi:hypothetical protein
MNPFRYLWKQIHGVKVRHLNKAFSSLEARSEAQTRFGQERPSPINLDQARLGWVRSSGVGFINTEQYAHQPLLSIGLNSGRCTIVCGRSVRSRFEITFLAQNHPVATGTIYG